MFALTLLDANCSLNITGKMESRPYIQLTHEALQHFGAQINENVFSPSLPLESPGKLTKMGAAARQMAVTDATERIVKVIEGIVK